MRNYLLVLLTFACVSCGSNSDISFPGTWDGSLPLVGNDCPFSAPSDQSQIFPVSISQIADKQLQVSAADGSSGTGVEDKDSFLVSSSVIGSQVTNTGGYSGCKIAYNFGFFAVDGSTAQAELTINFSSCTDSSNGSVHSCAIAYAGETTKR